MTMSVRQGRSVGSVKRRGVACKACGREFDERQVGRRHRGRGLDSQCYTRAERSGTLEKWPRLTRSWEDTEAEWHELERMGLKRSEAARALGIKVESLERTLQRLAQLRRMRSVCSAGKGEGDAGGSAGEEAEDARG